MLFIYILFLFLNSSLFDICQMIMVLYNCCNQLNNTINMYKFKNNHFPYTPIPHLIHLPPSYPIELTNTTPLDISIHAAKSIYLMWAYIQRLESDFF